MRDFKVSNIVILLTCYYRIVIYVVIFLLKVQYELINLGFAKKVLHRVGKMIRSPPIFLAGNKKLKFEVFTKLLGVCKTWSYLLF